VRSFGVIGGLSSELGGRCEDAVMLAGELSLFLLEASGDVCFTDKSAVETGMM
jgi:hypothetical protein